MRTTTPEEIVSILKEDFNIERDVYTVVRHSAEILNKMGMLETKKGVLRAVVKNYSVKLPPEAISIAAVVLISKPTDPTWKYELQDIYHPPQIVFRSAETEAEASTEVPKYIDNYIPDMNYGYYPYVWECPYLKFNETDVEVLVEYSEIHLDKNGFPRIPEEAKDACVHWSAFKYMKPLFMLGKVPIGVFNEVKNWKDKAVRQAKNTYAMKGLSRNNMNNVLNVISSFDRKSVNIDA